MGFESRLKQGTLNYLERTVQSFYDDQYYNNSCLTFKADYHSFDVSNSRYIDYWRSKGIFDCAANLSGKKPDETGETVSVNFNGNYFNQPKIDYNRSAMTIHIIYKLNNKRISSPDYTQVNGLFGICKLTKQQVSYIMDIVMVCVYFLTLLDNIMNPILEKLTGIC